MKTRAAKEIVRALEDEGVRYAFGIPGTHNIELYDALHDAEDIEAVLVTDEQAGAFLADGYGRSTGEVGVLNLVPGAGVTHALSGIAEAWMDNVPMVVIAGLTAWLGWASHAAAENPAGGSLSSPPSPPSPSSACSP